MAKPPNPSASSRQTVRSSAAGRKRRPPATHTLDSYIERIAAERPNDPDEWRIRFVAKTPKSPAAKAILSQLEEIRNSNMSVQAVFTSPRSKGQMKDAFDRLVGVFGPDEVRESVRVATFKAADQLPEQLAFGTKTGWAGDSLADHASEEVKCTALGPKAAKASGLAFDLLWEVSSEPTAYLRKTGAKARR